MRTKTVNHVSKCNYPFNDTRNKKQKKKIKVNIVWNCKKRLDKLELTDAKLNKYKWKRMIKATPNSHSKHNNDKDDVNNPFYFQCCK